MPQCLFVCGAICGASAWVNEQVPPLAQTQVPGLQERDFFIDNLLVRIHSIIEMIKWTGLAPWEFEFPFPGSLTSTFLGQVWLSLALPHAG